MIGARRRRTSTVAVALVLATVGVGVTLVTPSAQAAGSLTWRSGAVSYGNVPLTTSVDKTFVLDNHTASTVPFTLDVGSTAPGDPFSLISTTCGATLLPDKLCKATVRFTPNVVGTVTGELRAIDAGGTTILPLKGIGIATSTVAPTSVSLGPMAGGGTSLIRVVTLTNKLATTRTIDPITFSNPVFSRSGGTCGATLEGKKPCTIHVVFSPPVGAPATFTGTMSVALGGETPLTVTLSGSRVATVVASPTSRDIGTVAVGTWKDAYFEVKNQASYPVAISGPSTPAGPFSIVDGVAVCGPTLAPRSSCTAQVRYTPSAIGKQTAKVTIGWTDIGGTPKAAYVALKGTGVAGLTGVISPADWNTVWRGTWSTTRTITITNNGTTTTQLVDGEIQPYATPNPDYVLDDGTCATSSAGDIETYALFDGVELDPGESCTMTIRASHPVPTTFDKDLVLFFHGPPDTVQEVRIPVDVTFTGPSTPELTPWSLHDEFIPTQVGKSSGGQFTLRNTSTVDVTVTGLDATLDPAFSISNSNCGTAFPAVLHSGEYCSFGLRFAPTTAGFFDGTLVLHSNAGDFTYTSHGAAWTTVTTMTISEDQFDFGSVPVGSVSAPHTFTLTNTGLGVAYLSNQMDQTDFEVMATTCDAAVAPGGTCTITIRFAPQSAGLRNDGLLLYNNKLLDLELLGTGT